LAAAPNSRTGAEELTSVPCAQWPCKSWVITATFGSCRCVVWNVFGEVPGEVGVAPGMKAWWWPRVQYASGVSGTAIAQERLRTAAGVFTTLLLPQATRGVTPWRRSMGEQPALEVPVQPALGESGTEVVGSGAAGSLAITAGSNGAEGATSLTGSQTLTLRLCGGETSLKVVCCAACCAAAASKNSGDNRLRSCKMSPGGAVFLWRAGKLTGVSAAAERTSMKVFLTVTSLFTIAPVSRLSPIEGMRRQCSPP